MWMQKIIATIKVVVRDLKKIYKATYRSTL